MSDIHRHSPELFDFTPLREEPLEVAGPDELHDDCADRACECVVADRDRYREALERVRVAAGNGATDANKLWFISDCFAEIESDLAVAVELAKNLEAERDGYREALEQIAGLEHTTWPIQVARNALEGKK